MWIHLLPLGLIDGAGAGEVDAPPQPGGFLPYAKGERRARGLEWDKRKPVDELVQEAYERLYGDLRTVAPAEEVREAVAEHAQASDVAIPPPAAIDFAALAGDLKSAQRLLAIYREAVERKAQIEDEEDAIMVLLLS